MSRLLMLVLAGALLTCAAFAAPAPLPKPWVTGWDKPVDPLGDCKFRRKGDVLTIEVPGKEHVMHSLRLTAGWQSGTIEDFLDAALRCAEDSLDQPEGLPRKPTWRAFAEFLYGGKVYE